MSSPPDKSENHFGWALAAIVGIGAIVWISSGTNKTSTGTTPAFSDNSVTREDPETNLSAAAPAPTPLDVSAAQRGYAQFRKVSTVGARGSSQIYSRNCYDAIGKTFDWHQLDRCGGFDALASRWTEEADSIDDDALTYFQSEMAATRYLQAASVNGLPAPDADERWARIQSMARKTKLAAAPKIAVEPMDDDVDDETSLNALNELDAANIAEE